MQGKVPSISIKDFSTNNSGNTLALKNFCPKQLAVTVGKTEVKKPFFSLDKLNKLLPSKVLLLKNTFKNNNFDI